ncbi:hypothetical protein BHE74_00006450 [Ensete ventricosum]|uniref:Uncharacterized protein n=1 Tax=Ensete ventricosum TaxID=4639 RepID=A0A444E6M0_ENSVE|nr:hypothetical protein GW17_00030668 [Ensete ventricosum]RWW84925.1 hypothetical protein BHE74_00006450 [Ensete ventricosum]RZR71515.1 hypothetical protein BHM03_00005593 [Ensete ventricosum]
MWTTEISSSYAQQGKAEGSHPRHGAKRFVCTGWDPLQLVHRDQDHRTGKMRESWVTIDGVVGEDPRPRRLRGVTHGPTQCGVIREPRVNPWLGLFRCWVCQELFP